jgi:hypothetical protein
LSRSTIHGVIGLALFATGLVALYATLSPRPTDPVPQQAVGGEASVASEEADRIEGIPPAIERVLLRTGRASVLDSGAMGGIPPEVARVLLENDVTLTTPGRGDS